MATVEREDVSLWWETVDLTPPWLDEPETILFCHGVATDADIWSGWLPALADRYRLVRFDLRGCRRSPVAEDATWTMEALRDDVLAVADAAGVERFHYVGESTGGTLGLFMAGEGEARLRSVTGVSCGHRGGRIAHVAGWRDFIAAHGMERWSEDMMPKRFLADRADPAVQAWFHRVQATSDPKALLATAALLIATDLGLLLPRITLPVLLLAGDRSPFVPVATMAEIRAAVPHAELQVFPGARHALACSHGAECAAALRGFLARRV